jgi:hypothetical protein
MEGLPVNADGKRGKPRKMLEISPGDCLGED